MQEVLNPTEIVCMSSPCSCTVQAVVFEISQMDTTSLTGGNSLYTRPTCLFWLRFASVYFLCVHVHMCVRQRQGTQSHYNDGCCH